MPILEASPFDFLNKRFIFALFGSAFGSGLQHGYHIGIANSAGEVIQGWMSKLIFERDKTIPSDNLVTLLWSGCVSIFSLGGAIGGFLTTLVADRMGRRGGLIMNNGLLFFATLFLSMAHLFKTFEMFVLGRFLIGINVGLNAGLAPLYLVEISPDCIRGSVATLYQLHVTFGMFFANIIGLRDVLGNDKQWPYIFVLPLLPSVIQIFVMIICPESPKYLFISKNDFVGADRALTFLRQSKEIDDELDKLAHENSLQRPKVHIIDLCEDYTIRHPLIICIILMMSQQLSGMNAITSYSVPTLKALGFLRFDPSYTALGLTFLYFLTTIAAVLMMDIAGRRSLLIFSFVGMTVILFFLCITILFMVVKDALSYVYICISLFYVIAYGVGAGPIPWFATPELLPHKARALGASVTLPINFLVDFVVCVGYFLLINVISRYGFFIFLVCNFSAFFLVFFFVPETKRYTASDIIEYFK